jgi:GntR family transcriptional regulator
MNNKDDALLKYQQPLYLRIEKIIREMLDGIEYEPGDRIPSERELAEKFSASRMTIRRVIEKLTTQGFLERRSTSGTFVSKPEVTRTFNPAVVQSLTRQLQGESGAVDSKLLSFNKIPAPDKISKLLCLKSADPVFFVERLRLIGGLPFCIEYSYLPEEPFKELTEENVKGHNSLYKYLHLQYDIVPSNSSDKLKISLPTETEAIHLGLSLNDPVLYLKSVVYDSDGNPFEIVKSINHPHRVVFQSKTSINTDKQK